MHDEEIVYEPVSLGRSRLRLLVPVVLTVAVLAFGFVGAHLPSSATPSPSPLTEASEAAIAATAAPSPDPADGDSTPPDPLLPGVARIVPTGVVTVDLPPDVSSPSLAVASGRLFYVADGQRIQAVPVAPGASPATLVTEPACHAIDQLAIAGDTLLFDVVAPFGAAGVGTACGSAYTLGWTIWRYDLATGRQTVVASGSSDVPISWGYGPLVHLTATESAFAVERMSVRHPLDPVTIEVHALDGSLLWTTTAPSAVTALTLGGGRLAAVTADGVLRVADHVNRAFRAVATDVGDASLSPDGRYLVWQALDQRNPRREIVEVRDLDGSVAVPLASAPQGSTSEVPGPIVRSTGDGPRVAWYVRLRDGTMAPAFIDPSHPGGAIVDSPQFPAWIGFDGDRLVWVVASLDGTARALAVDIARLQPPPSPTTGLR